MIRFLQDLAKDLVFASRTLTKTPAIALPAILTVAAGIGAGTAIFTVAHAILFKPLSYKDPDQLIVLNETRVSSPGLNRVSPGVARDLLRHSNTIEAISLYGDGGGGRFMENGEAEILRGQRVSTNFFDVLGVRAQLGRVFIPGDSLAGHDNDIVLSHFLWTNRFGADPAIVGRALNLSGRLGRVIGVLPPDFHALHMSNPGELPQLFQPLPIDEVESPDRTSGYSTIARLRPGVKLSDAQSELNAILKDDPFDTRLLIQRFSENLTAKVSPILRMLLVAGGLVLLITCANVATLVLTLSNARAREIAVRSAVGASAQRLIRQAATECLFISGLGGLIGLALAWAGTSALAALAPDEIPRSREICFDQSVLLFGLLTSLLVAALLSIAPALRISRLDLNDILRGVPGSHWGRFFRGRSAALVIAQIACAFVLASGAGLLARSLIHLMHANVGYDSHNILTMTTLIYDHTPEQRIHHYQQIVERVRGLPGVVDVAMVNTLPLASPAQNTIYAENQVRGAVARPPVVDQYFATPGYFRVMRIPLRRGRFFTQFDTDRTGRVAVISESSAKLLFPGVDPIGKRVRMGGSGSDSDDLAGWTTVIGIAGDVWQHGMDAGPGEGIYLPQSQHSDSYYRLLVRATGNPWRIYPAVRKTLREIDPKQAIFHIQPMDDYITKSLADRISALALIGMLGLLALLLAAMGIYGVVSYSIAARTREIGIRMALGAGRRPVAALVTADVLSMLVRGLLIGILLSLAFNQFLAHLLYQVNPQDWIALALSISALAAIALLAGLVPCLRAVAISPLNALRYS